MRRIVLALCLALTFTALAANASFALASETPEPTTHGDPPPTNTTGEEAGHAEAGSEKSGKHAEEFTECTPHVKHLAGENPDAWLACYGPIAEFELPRIGPKLMIGPIDMSINKAVIYMWIAAAICCIWMIRVGRRMELKPNGRQTFTEVVYEFARNALAKATLGEETNPVYRRYMPYVASLFLFLWVVNLVSFFPLPFGEHSHYGSLPDLGLYAATSNINVTLALTVMTLVLAHYEGVRNNGGFGYLKSWLPAGVPKVLAVPIWCLEAMSQTLRLVSLSVRLFANMLAGHLLILMMLGLTIIIGSVGVAVGVVPIALFFFLFEFGLVATLQAFIFAMLSGIYIKGAAEPAH